ncbi:MAG: phosphopantetheine-binding protein [Ideonella sp.]
MSATLEKLLVMAHKNMGLEDGKIDPQATFTELGLDSLSLVDFLFSVEDEYRIDIEEKRAMVQPTLTGLAALVDELVASKTPVSA